MICRTFNCAYCYLSDYKNKDGEKTIYGQINRCGSKSMRLVNDSFLQLLPGGTRNIVLTGKQIFLELMVQNQ